MANLDLGQFGLDRAESGDDVVVPFTLEELDSRGRAVRLATSLDEILTRHDYPIQVARLLGEAVTLCALIGSSLKFDGRFILQTQGDGAVNMIVVDFVTPGALRAYARFDQQALATAIERNEDSTSELLGKGHLAMTIDQGANTERYQGIVELDGNGFEQAAVHYFAQSEQIPTMVRLAVAQHAARGGDGLHWRAGGMMVQFLPKTGEKMVDDLAGGGLKEGDGADHEAAPDHWLETKALFQTLSDAELVDPAISAERLLFRLYNEKGVRVFDPVHVEAHCTCSADRSEAMLAGFSDQERQEMAIDGEIEVVCEFCSASYHFNPHQFKIKH
ncbi:33 kDa chaperonin HslO [hydrothermal vent metagenome]|uniref:33 kDa chaperonin HslO n=1 Tax=hydrothermal vent metagenome TaxID=652676 RepID=A0A3B0U2S3_9ZZZZ